MTTVYEKDHYRLTIEQDPDAESPREWDEYTTMVCAHDRYRLGDEQAVGFANHRDWDLYLKETILDGVEEDDVVWLPLYLYDHSGITMSTTPFSSRWDSGQVGWIYANKDDLMGLTGVYDDNHFSDDKAYEVLENVVKTYDQYLTGNVYGYTLEKQETCACCQHIKHDHVDSCWGIYADSEINARSVVKEMLIDDVDGIINDAYITKEV